MFGSPFLFVPANAIHRITEKSVLPELPCTRVFCCYCCYCCTPKFNQMGQFWKSVRFWWNFALLPLKVHVFGKNHNEKPWNLQNYSFPWKMHFSGFFYLAILIKNRKYSLKHVKIKWILMKNTKIRTEISPGIWIC